MAEVAKLNQIAGNTEHLSTSNCSKVYCLHALVVISFTAGQNCIAYLTAFLQIYFFCWDCLVMFCCPH